MTMENGIPFLLSMKSPSYFAGNSADKAEALDAAFNYIKEINHDRILINELKLLDGLHIFCGVRGEG